MLWNLLLLGAVIAFLFWKTWKSRRSPEQLQKMAEALKGGGVLLDIRTPTEFARFHLPKAKNIPLQSLAKRCRELGKNKTPVVVYCDSGARSAHALPILKAAGFQQIFDLGSRRNWDRMPK